MSIINLIAENAADITTHVASLSEIFNPLTFGDTAGPQYPEVPPPDTRVGFKDFFNGAVKDKGLRIPGDPSGGVYRPRGGSIWGVEGKWKF